MKVDVNETQFAFFFSAFRFEDLFLVILGERELSAALFPIQLITRQLEYNSIIYKQLHNEKKNSSFYRL